MLHGMLEKEYDLKFLEQLKETHSQKNMSSFIKIRNLAAVLDIGSDLLAPYEDIFNYELPIGKVAIAYAAGYDTIKISEYPKMDIKEHLYISNLLRAVYIAYRDSRPDKKKLIYNYREHNLSPTCEELFNKMCTNESCMHSNSFPVTQIIIGSYIMESGNKKTNGYYGVAYTSVECRNCLILRD